MDLNSVYIPYFFVFQWCVHALLLYTNNFRSSFCWAARHVIWHTLDVLVRVLFCSLSLSLALDFVEPCARVLLLYHGNRVGMTEKNVFNCQYQGNWIDSNSLASMRLIILIKYNCYGDFLYDLHDICVNTHRFEWKSWTLWRFNTNAIELNRIWRAMADFLADVVVDGWIVCLLPAMKEKMDVYCGSTHTVVDVVSICRQFQTILIDIQIYLRTVL